MRHQKSAGNRLPEKWFRRGLWLIAFIFASFLIGLGGKVINDLPSVEQTRELDDYMGEKGILLQQTRDRLNEEDTRLTEEAERSALELEKQRNQTAAEQQSLQNWLAARSATEQSEQNPEVIARTRKLDELKAKEQTLQQQYAAIQQRQLDNRQQRPGEPQVPDDGLDGFVSAADSLQPADDHLPDGVLIESLGADVDGVDDAHCGERQHHDDDGQGEEFQHPASCFQACQRSSSVHEPVREALSR